MLPNQLKEHLHGAAQQKHQHVIKLSLSTQLTLLHAATLLQHSTCF
jgi:hypothetical protein